MVAATIDRGFGIKGKAHGQESTVRGYQLEDADYEGHSLSMLQRIATALGQEVKIVFVPSRRRANA
jgi:hypothetical protein